MGPNIVVTISILSIMVFLSLCFYSLLVFTFSKIHDSKSKSLKFNTSFKSILKVGAQAGLIFVAILLLGLFEVVSISTLKPVGSFIGFALLMLVYSYNLQKNSTLVSISRYGAVKKWGRACIISAIPYSVFLFVAVYRGSLS